MRVMVLWSGGVESTALLNQLLECSDYEVHAHHIQMHNREGRMHEELSAIEKLEPHLQKIRSFSMTRSYVEICGGDAMGMDFAIQYPIGLVAMRHQKCERLFRAGCLEDDWDHRRLPDGTWHHNRPNPLPGASHRRRALALQPLLQRNECGATIAPWLPYYSNTKSELWERLGPLAELTWSCRTPLSMHEECGKCHSCLERNAAKRGTSAIREVAEMIRRAS